MSWLKQTTHKCYNLDCKKIISTKYKYCSRECRQAFPWSAIMVNKVIKAFSLEEFYRKYYIIYNSFPKKELVKLFNVSYASLKRLYDNVFKYTTMERIEKYKRREL